MFIAVALKVIFRNSAQLSDKSPFNFSKLLNAFSKLDFLKGLGTVRLGHVHSIVPSSEV